MNLSSATRLSPLTLKNSSMVAAGEKDEMIEGIVALLLHVKPAERQLVLVCVCVGVTGSGLGVSQLWLAASVDDGLRRGGCVERRW